MKDIEKFQIASTEDGFFVESHNSPILDDKFYSKFRKMKETKKDCEVHYINLGNLLRDHGEEIMDTLTDKKYLSIMDIPFIKYLVMFQWFNIKSTIHKFLLTPFFALIFFFTFFAMTIDFRDNAPDEFTFIDMINNFNALLLIITLFYFFYMEFIQFKTNPADYFVSFWNLTDLISYSMCLIVVIFDRTPVPNVVNRPIASLCLIVLWVKMFYFLRVFETTSRLIRMIIEIVNDMTNFLIVLTIGILGFSGGFYILQQGTSSAENLYPVGEVPMNVIWTYRLAMGDFQIDFFDELGSQTDYVLAWILFVVGTLFLVIVLLNLLIAIMGDTFSRVLENITNLSVREKVMLVSENESLFNRATLFA